MSVHKHVVTGYFTEIEQVKHVGHSASSSTKVESLAAKPQLVSAPRNAQRA